jgi:hypothetical protein
MHRCPSWIMSKGRQTHHRPNTERRLGRRLNATLKSLLIIFSKVACNLSSFVGTLMERRFLFLFLRLEEHSPLLLAIMSGILRHRAERPSRIHFSSPFPPRPSKLGSVLCPPSTHPSSDSFWAWTSLSPGYSPLISPLSSSAPSTE